MKLPLVNLVVTVFLLWLTIQLESSLEVYLAYFFILTVGIVHGANDISLISLITKGSSSNKLKYLLIYIGVIAFMSLTFFQFPFLALGIFVIFSCYHFGEQHFYSLVKHNTIKANALFFCYGALIFSLLFYLNAEASSNIIFELTQVRISDDVFLILLVSSVVLTASAVILNVNNFKEEFKIFQELFLLLVFVLLFKLASLLWAFAIYFIVWHSIPSLRDQTIALHGKLDKSSLLRYFKSSVVYWVISLVGLGLFYYFSTLVDIRFITLFFAFLAAITIPHVVVMYFLNKK